MDNKEFNEQRHNRKKQQYRFILGIQQLWNYPLLNLIWGLFAGGVVFLVMAKSKYIAMTVTPAGSNIGISLNTEAFFEEYDKFYIEKQSPGEV